MGPAQLHIEFCICPFRLHQIMVLGSLDLQVHMREQLSDSLYGFPQIQIQQFQIGQYAILPAGTAIIHQNRRIYRKVTQVLMEGGHTAAGIDGESAAVFHKERNGVQIALRNFGFGIGHGPVKIHGQ